MIFWKDTQILILMLQKILESPDPSKPGTKHLAENFVLDFEGDCPVPSMAPSL